MSVFITAIYPKLMFYAPSREEPYYFANGIFDTDDVEDPRLRKEVEQVLIKMCQNPGFTGVQTYEETKADFSCVYCGKGFPSQAAKFGHEGRMHKSDKQMEEEALREGAVVPSGGEPRV